MKHINALAYMKYSGFKYEWSLKSLEQLIEELGCDLSESVELCKEKIIYPKSVKSKIGRILFAWLCRINISMGTRTVNIFANLTKSRIEIYPTQIQSCVERNQFLYENLVNWNLYDVRLLDKKYVNATLDLRNYCGLRTLEVLMDVINPHSRALQDLWSGGMFPTNKTLQLEVLIDESNDSTTSMYNSSLKKVFKDTQAPTLNIKIRNLPYEKNILRILICSDIQILPENPTQLSLAVAIMHPAKLVLVDEKASLKLRNWTLYQT
jgi:hypothetical protein